MNWIYKKICLPLMLIDNNVYTFLSGILISLSTNIFTTLCFEKLEIVTQWHLYLSVLLYLISGALCIYLATKMTGYQNYIYSKQIISVKEKKSIIKDVTGDDKAMWCISFLICIVTLILGTVFLFINYLFLK